jgi:ribokinase
VDDPERGVPYNQASEILMARKKKTAAKGGTGRQSKPAAPHKAPGAAAPLPRTSADAGRPAAPRPAAAQPAPIAAPSAAPPSPPPQARPQPAQPVGHTMPLHDPVLNDVLKAVSSTGPGKASAGGPRSGVAVVGSINMDLVVRTEVMPGPGQTVMGQDLLQNPGGKGSNQATAAGKLWQKRTAGSRLVGRIGDDVFGQNALEALRKARVETDAVLTTRHVPTGTAMILVDRHGENSIIVAGGANRHLSATDMLAHRKTIESSVVLLAQLEVPADTVACAFALAKRSNVLTILDPAPAPAEGLPESLYHVDILIPNQIEAQLLTGIQIRTAEDARRAAERFLLRGARIVIIKMGSQGAVVIHKPEDAGAGAPAVAHLIPGFRVPVLDTTAAGDAFAGALAVGLAEGMGLAAAVRFANAAGALACTKPGVMSAMPTRIEVENLINPPPPPPPVTAAVPEVKKKG